MTGRDRQEGDDPATCRDHRRTEKKKGRGGAEAQAGRPGRPVQTQSNRRGAAPGQPAGQEGENHTNSSSRHEKDERWMGFTARPLQPSTCS